MKSTNNLDVVVSELLSYMDSCTKDKYSSKEVSDINTSKELFGEHSMIVNCWNIKKYLKRYMTTGFDKSRQRIDLLKVIHYALFELEATRQEPASSSEGHSAAVQSQIEKDTRQG